MLFINPKKITLIPHLSPRWILLFFELNNPDRNKYQSQWLHNTITIMKRPFKYYHHTHNLLTEWTLFTHNVSINYLMLKDKPILFVNTYKQLNKKLIRQNFWDKHLVVLHKKRKRLKRYVGVKGLKPESTLCVTSVFREHMIPFVYQNIAVHCWIQV